MRRRWQRAPRALPSVALAGLVALAAIALGAGGPPWDAGSGPPAGTTAPRAGAAAQDRFVPFVAEARGRSAPAARDAGARAARERRTRAADAADPHTSGAATPRVPRRPAPVSAATRARARVSSTRGAPAPLRAPSYGVVRLRGRVALRSRPAGRPIARIAARTEFGSPRVLGVVRSSGGWLGVATSALPNGRLGWLRRRDPAVRLESTRVALHVDLSSRRLVLSERGRRVRMVSVAVGRPAHPTPTGRFAVTDRLVRLPAAYGCCALALSGHQPYLPPGWPGGDRLAIHGTSSPASIGTAASTGCLRAGAADMRALLRRVPLGAPVFIRP